MNERQHHLNESSSARLGRSQQLEILPNPNSKQTRSLGAFSDGRIDLAHISRETGGSTSHAAVVKGGGGGVWAAPRTASGDA